MVSVCYEKCTPSLVMFAVLFEISLEVKSDAAVSAKYLNTFFLDHGFHLSLGFDVVMVLGATNVITSTISSIRSENLD